MPFVKLDCGMLNSTLWFERLAREIFITALLMAEPIELKEEEPQIEIGSLDLTGWKVPPGRYGFVAAASVGIIRRAMIPKEEIEHGLEAMKMLGSPESASRSQDHEGRRLVRIDGGFIVLNYDKYRERDYTAAARQARFRMRHSNTVTPSSNGVTSRPVTQAEAEADKKKRQAKPAQSDSDWIRELQQSDAYKHTNVVHQHAKMVEWCKVRNLTPTRRRFINWLNKEDKPLKHTAARPSSYGQRTFAKSEPAREPTEAEFQSWATAGKKAVAELKEKLNPSPAMNE